MYLTIKQAAERLNVSTKTISRKIRAGEIPIHRLGEKFIRINEEDLKAFMDKYKTA